MVGDRFSFPSHDPTGHMLQNMAGSMFLDPVTDISRLNENLSPTISELQDMGQLISGIVHPDYYNNVVRDKGLPDINDRGLKPVKALKGQDKRMEDALDLLFPGLEWYTDYDEKIQSQVGFIK